MSFFLHILICRITLLLYNYHLLLENEWNAMHIPINKFCLVKPISFFGKLFNILIPCGNFNYFILLCLTDRILHAFHYKYDKSFCRTTIQVILHANNSSRTILWVFISYINCKRRTSLWNHF